MSKYIYIYILYINKLMYMAAGQDLRIGPSQLGSKEIALTRGFLSNIICACLCVCV